MDYTLVKSFFQDQATANGWEFAHNIEHLSEKIGSGLKGKNNLILVMDEPRGRGKYTGHHYDMPSYGFWLLRKVEKGKWQEEDSVYQEAKNAMYALEAEMVEMREDETGIFAFYDPNSLDYVKAGPETKERMFGIYVSFSCEDPL